MEMCGYYLEILKSHITDFHFDVDDNMLETINDDDNAIDCLCNFLCKLASDGTSPQLVCRWSDWLSLTLLDILFFSMPYNMLFAGFISNLSCHFEDLIFSQFLQ